jgi:hypothetical protein
MTDWDETALGSIMAQTDVYLHKPNIKANIGFGSELLQERSGTISLAELSECGP